MGRVCERKISRADKSTRNKLSRAEKSARNKLSRDKMCAQGQIIVLKTNKLIRQISLLEIQRITRSMHKDIFFSSISWFFGIKYKTLQIAKHFS